MTLDDLAVDAAVHELRPDFAVLAVAVAGLSGGSGDAASEARLTHAEALARDLSAPHPHVAAWHDAYRAFGAKPQRTAPSVDALIRRARAGGLPRVNWVVDLYNAVSVAHVLPVGGEDLDGFVGPLRLIRATGIERFDTVKDGQPHAEHAEPGEVVWADDQGVTCRRWNWRQGTRTRLHEGSTRALFLLERLAPMPLEALAAAADALVADLLARTPGLAIGRRLIGPKA